MHCSSVANIKIHSVVWVNVNVCMEDIELASISMLKSKVDMTH